ncbi:MAG: helix-turn-helix domain-containing protein [Anaerolineae bacterium]|nr:helix-turn-helix domain-containing protein [Anaerolineae bacterium]
MNYDQHVPAAERTLQLLELLAATPEGLTAQELSTTLDIPRSALFALLNTLKGLGYIEQARPRHPYLAGPRLRNLHPMTPTSHTTLIQAFYEAITHTPPEETIALTLLSNDRVFVLAEAPCQKTVRTVMDPGEYMNAVENPAGWVLLAGLSDAERHHRLNQEITPALQERLMQAKHQGAAHARGRDQHQIAVPVCSNGYTPSAALLMSIPTFRWNPQYTTDLLQKLREVAARISHRMGAVTYQPYGTHNMQALGSSVSMSTQELETFLSGPWAARLACVRPDGSPHVVPVWYEWHQDKFLVVAWPGSVWANFVLQNPAVALTIDEPWPPLRRVLIRGMAQQLNTLDLPEGEPALYQRLQVRYLGKTVSAITDGQRIEPQWTAFAIPPTRLIAQRERTRETNESHTA